MDFSIKACNWNSAAQTEMLRAQSSCIVIGLFEGSPVLGVAQQIDQAMAGSISRLLKAGEINGQCGKAWMLHETVGVSAARVLVVGLGQRENFNAKIFAQAVRAAARVLLTSPLFVPQVKTLLWTLVQECNSEVDVARGVRLSICLTREIAYQFTQLKSQAETSQSRPQKIIITVHAADEKSAKASAKQGVALASGMDFARDLANLPGNICTPTYLAQTAKELAHEFALKAEILGQKQLETLKMGAFLSVAKGSVEPPKLIVLHYQGAAAKTKPIVLVGKGITFDAGGISLKPGEGMDEMKYDMCGAAAALGTLRAVAEMALKLNLIVVIPSCENMPAGNAYKPGDIVTSMSGQTIEVLNTDAEGRLILCDALTYVERFKPALVIDIATLTGACVIALGHHHSGLFAKEDALANELLAAAAASVDPIWRMPLDEEYQEQLKSNFADMANIGGRPAGSVTAACFLARFTQAYSWAHLDIAGTAWKSGAAKGATGRPVPLLTQFLIERASR